MFCFLSSALYDHQDIRRSIDSGVYSTEGSKCQQHQLNSSQSSIGADQGPVDLDPVKIHDTSPGHDSQCEIADECFIDLCV